MKRRFKLLKDLPDYKTGTTFEWDKSNPLSLTGTVWVNGEQVTVMWTDYFERHPDWFKQLDNPPMKSINLDEQSGFVLIAVGGDSIGHYRYEIPATKRDILRSDIETLKELASKWNLEEDMVKVFIFKLEALVNKKALINDSEEKK